MEFVGQCLVAGNTFELRNRKCFRTFETSSETQSNSFFERYELYTPFGIQIHPLHCSFSRIYNFSNALGTLTHAQPDVAEYELFY